MENRVLFEKDMGMNSRQIKVETTPKDFSSLLLILFFFFLYCESYLSYPSYSVIAHSTFSS